MNYLLTIKQAIMKKFLIGLMMITFTSVGFAQVTGQVVDSETNEPLPGAVVTEEGTSNSITTDFEGSFSFSGAEGSTLVVSFIGYSTQTVVGKDGMIISLLPATNVLSEVVVTSGVIDVAKVRETPVAVSTISPAEISLKTGNLEFPEIMNTTPGVYATKQGGGYGDSRISLRGFDQTNTSFLINGQPVNDMENGRLYWSNWQGLTDVASGIQIQRGLGASKLAVPSVGGTVSIFTKAAERTKGGSLTQTMGNDGYFKTSAVYNSGKDKNGWATSFLLSRWMGNGYINNTAGEGYNYFAAVGYAPEGSDHSLNLTFLGAGQWHHQRDVWVSIRDYQNFSADNGYKGEGGEINRRWNTNGGTLNGEEFSMRRNFYNKPLATLNWDWEINSNLKLVTSLYGSAGRGGGTGPRGNNYRNGDLDILPFRKDLTEHYLEDGRGSRNEDGTIDFDALVAENQASTSGYTGDISGFAGQLIGSNGFRDSNVNRAVLVRRASMNSHDWVGAISNLEGEFGNWRTSVGVDLRQYKGYHYRVLNDLMGLDGYFSGGNRNSAGTIVNTTTAATPFTGTGLDGPKIDYFNNGIVGWQGVNGLVEYNSDNVYNVVLQGGLSNQSFQREDFFDVPSEPISQTANILGGYLKGGANYNVTDVSNFFMNAGFISRQPQFGAVFPNYSNTINEDLENEEIRSVELGYGYTTNDLRINVNAYSTTWGNRFQTVSLSNANGVDGTAQFRDIDVRHNGIEIEADYNATDKLRLKAMGSFGDWRYIKDFSATLFDDNQQEVGEGTLYLKGAKVGDAAQTTAYFSADYKVVKSTSVDLGVRLVDGLYADYSIIDAEFYTPDNRGAVKLPSYGLVDLGLTHRVGDFTLRLNVNNLLNTVYIAESNTSIHADENSTTWNGVDTRNSVWFGFGRTWNASLKYNF
jgi:outer membrane cobalamin receptor